LTRIRSLNPFLGVKDDHIEALVDVGLWIKTDGGIQMKDWSEWNETKQQKDERLQKDRDRKKLARSKGKNSKVRVDVPPDVQADGEQTSDGSPGTGTGTGTGKDNSTAEDLGNSPDDETEPFTDPSQDREWMQVVKAYTEVTGLPVAAHYQESDAKAILALAKQMDDSKYLEIVQRALKSWWADEWVQKHSLPLSNLVKNFAKFAGVCGKKSQVGLDYTSKLRLIELPEIIKDIKFSLEHAEDCGDQVAMEKHQRNLNKVAKEYDSLREMDR
jgi:hypothetical protein